MIKTKVKAGIVGATGYAGSELVRLLCRHPQVRLVYAGSHSYAGKVFSDIYPNMRGVCDLVLDDDDIANATEVCEVLFLALPAGIASNQITSDILEKCVIIDLGADYRLSDPQVYETWYKTGHGSPELLEKAVYGLCELYRERIAQSRLIANPGCYTTCSILSLTPLLKAGLIEPEGIVIDAKSGVSGAGRSEKLGSLYCECNESVKAYGVGDHRHTPEIEEQLSWMASEGKAGTGIVLQFTPHLIPMDRGILATCYAKLKAGVTAEQVAQAYQSCYNGERFIRILGEGNLPETRWVKGSNRCDIGWKLDNRTGRIIVVGAIDNLEKGAAGQAVQNMNICFGLEENAGLDAAAAFPM